MPNYHSVKSAIKFELDTIGCTRLVDFEIIPGRNFDKIVYKFSNKLKVEAEKGVILNTLKRTATAYGYNVFEEIRVESVESI